MSFDPRKLSEALARELGADWAAPLPPNPTARQEVDAWCADMATIHAAAERAKARLRDIDFHRARLRELEAA